MNTSEQLSNFSLSSSKMKMKSKFSDSKKYNGVLKNQHIGNGDSENLSFEEKIQPIGYYIDDRKAMINQVFSVITERKLRAMLPPILKGLAVDELKSLCFDQLLGMSSKRILSILDGCQLESSSDSDDFDEINSTGSDRPNLLIEPQQTLDIDGNSMSDNDLETAAVDVDMLEIGITEQEVGDLLEDSNLKKVGSKEKHQNKRKRKHVSKRQQKEVKNKNKNLKEKEVMDKIDILEGQVIKEDEESKSKTLLEILELEMRARAIRALLKEDNKEVPESSSKSKDVHNLYNRDNINALVQLLPKIKTEVIEIIDSESSNELPDAGQCLEGTSSIVSSDVCSIVDKEQSMLSTNAQIENNGDLEKENTDEIVTTNLNIDLVHTKENVLNGGSSSDSESVIVIDCETDIVVLDDDDDHFESETKPSEEEAPNLNLSDETKKNDILSKSKNYAESNDITKNTGQVSKSAGNVPINKDEVIKSSIEEEDKLEQNVVNVGSLHKESCSSWSDRWLQSKSVQKVVTDSKFCAKIMKRIKSSKKVKEPHKLDGVELPCTNSSEVIGSVQEYQSLSRGPEHGAVSAHEKTS